MRYTRTIAGALVIAGSLLLSACGGHNSSVPSVGGGSQGSGVLKLASTGLAALSSYNIDKTKTAVVGISSGGFMAADVLVAFSKTFHYAAVYAGGVYDCAADSLNTAELDCMDAFASELSASESYLNQQSSAGTIDNESNLSGDKAYLWSGTADTTVKQAGMNDLNTEFQHYGVSTKYDNGYPAQHGWESPYGEVACGTSSSPYMIDCSNYDSEQTWLSFFYGTLNAKNTGTLNGSLINFDQTPYGGGANSLDTNGWIFVPQSCANGTQCKLVVALHGCLQGQAQIGTKFITESGIDQWADANNVIVLYPYAVETSGSNPNGCWDWWGYTNSSYALQSGVQMQFLINMVNHLQGGGSTATPSPAPSATPTPAPTPTPNPTPAPAPTPTPTPSSLGCWTTGNYYHVQAGRAHDSGGYALANGSNQNMGLDNVFYTTSLSETSANYYVIVSGC